MRGTHGITLGEHVLIHPGAQLVSVHGPTTIDDKCIVSEKCVVGGPLQATTATRTGAGNDARSDNVEDEEEPDPVKTTIGQSVYLHAGSHVHAGATIRNAVIIESNVTILPGVTIGSHSKICAGLTVDRDVDEWTVMMGDGDVRRKRRRRQLDPAAAVLQGDDGDESYGDAAELVESMRLKAMDKEREGIVTIFRMAQRVASLARKK